MAAANAWLVCAPGDPTEAQWRAIREMSNGDAYCATQWNARSEYVRVEISRPIGVTDVYTISPDGTDARFIETRP